MRLLGPLMLSPSFCCSSLCREGLWLRGVCLSLRPQSSGCAAEEGIAAPAIVSISSTMKHAPHFLYLKDFPFTLPFTMALPGLAPGLSPFLPSRLSTRSFPDPDTAMTSASAWLCSMPAPAYGTDRYQQHGHPLASAGAGQGVLLLPAPRDPSRSEAGSDPAADTAACLLTRITGSCCRLALEICQGDRLGQPPPRRDGNGAVGGGVGEGA